MSVSPQKLGRYLLVRRLAGGGMAEVYLAKLVGAAGFEKDVAVKKILPQWSQHADFVAMLVDEAKIAVQLDHPNIVPIYELARDGDTTFIAMEYVRGWDVRRLILETTAKKKRIPEDVALFILIEVLAGLAYAHDRKDAKGRPLGVVHRDISPQNILLSETGDVKITDFGIAKAASRSHETATGVLKGKFAYMSPEQASPEKKTKVDGRSDLFSAAIVLYEMLACERLFYRGSDLETLDRVRRAQVDASPQALQLIPKPLLQILLKALALSPADRFSNASAFRDALEDYAAQAGLKPRRESLAAFLRAVFGGETPAARDAEETRTAFAAGGETLLASEETRVFGGSETLVEGSLTRLLPDSAIQTEDRPPLRSGRPIAAAIVSFVVLYVLVAFFVRSRSAHETETPPAPAAAAETKPAALPETRAETRPASAPETHAASADFESVPVVKLKEVPVAKGYLSVQAVPWGTVSIDGGKRRWETPVRRIPLPAGRHTVRVAYEPDGSVLTSSVSVAEGKEIVCVAKFRSGKELRCRK